MLVLYGDYKEVGVFMETTGHVRLYIGIDISCRLMLNINCDIFIRRLEVTPLPEVSQCESCI